jgi:hypothetical protein
MRKIFIFLVLIFLSSLFISKLLDHFYRKHWDTTFSKLETVFNDTTNRDIVFAGDSKVQFGINPFYIDSITTKNSYNIGMGGAPFTETVFLTKAWLNNHRPPKIFVVSIGLAGLIDTEKYFSTSSFYFSFLKDTLAYNTLSMLHYHTSLNKFIPLTKYTNFDAFQKTSIIRSMMGNQYLEKNGIGYKGFINNATDTSFKEDGNFKLEQLKIKNDKSLDTALERINELISIVRSYKSDIIFVYPPSYRMINDTGTKLYFQKLRNRIDDVLQINNVKLLHFDNDSSFTKSLFQDPSHLNIQGSILYSKKLGIELKELIK